MNARAPIQSGDPVHYPRPTYTILAPNYRTVKRNLTLIAGSLLVLASQTTSTARESFKLVHLFDDAAEGTNKGQFLDFSTSIINNNLEVAYLGRLQAAPGIGLANNDGIWAGNLTDGNALAGREGDQAPGTPNGVKFTNLVQTSTFQINDNNSFVMRAVVQGPGVTNDNRTGIWRKDSGVGNLTLIAREGTPAPGTDGVFRSIELPAQDNTSEDRIYFKTRLSGGTVTFSDDTAIYEWSKSGGLVLLIREGDVTPVLPVGATGPGTPARYGQLLKNVTCSDDGTLIFSTNFQDLASPFLNSGLLIRAAGGPASVVMQENTPLPDATGTPTAALIAGWETYGINNSSEVILRVNLRFGFGGVAIANNEALITNAGGTPMRLLAREGDVTPEGGNTHHIFRNVFIGNASGICTGTTLSGNVDSIYSAAAGGGLVNIAKEGTPAVDTDSTYLSLSRPAMNHEGQVLYSSTLAIAATTTGTNNAGLWRTDGPGTPPADPLGLISRKGEVEDDLCGPIIAYDLNAPNQPTGGVSGSGRAINDAENLVVNLLTSVAAPIGHAVEGVYILGDDGPVFCDAPPNELRNIAVGTGPISVSWIPPTVIDDNDPPPVVVASHTPGDLFSVGVTVVTYTATDSAGQVATYRFRVIITEIRDTGKMILDPGILVENGDPAAPSHEYRIFSRVCLNDSGEVTVEGSTMGNLRGVWSNGGAGAGGPLSALAVGDESAFGGLDFQSFFDIRISDRSASSFGSSLKPGLVANNDGALFLGPGPVGLGAYESDPAPGTTGVWRQLFPQAQSQSSTDDTIFFPAFLLRGMGGIDVSNDSGIWHYDLLTATTVKVVGEGDPIVGIPDLAGLDYGHVVSRVVTGGDTQHFVYTALLSGAGITGLTNEALFRSDFGDTPELVVREGTAAPGPNDNSSQFLKSFSVEEKLARRHNGIFQSFTAEAVSPDGSELAFISRLKSQPYVDSKRDTGVWHVDAANEIKLVAREGHQAAGLAEGICFSRFDDILVDNDGWVSFRAWLRHDVALGIDSSNDGGIWTNDGGFLRWIAHEGQLAPNTDGGIVRHIPTFSQLDTGMASVLTLSPGSGDVLLSNNNCLVSGFNGLTGLMEINLREGDRFDNGNPELDWFTLFLMDHPFNPLGGSGGLLTSVQGSIDRVAFKAAFTHNSDAVLIRELSNTGP